MSCQPTPFAHHETLNLSARQETNMLTRSDIESVAILPYPDLDATKYRFVVSAHAFQKAFAWTKTKIDGMEMPFHFLTGEYGSGDDWMFAWCMVPEGTICIAPEDAEAQTIDINICHRGYAGAEPDKLQYLEAASLLKRMIQ